MQMSREQEAGSGQSREIWLADERNSNVFVFFRLYEQDRDLARDQRWLKDYNSEISLEMTKKKARFY